MSTLLSAGSKLSLLFLALLACKSLVAQNLSAIAAAIRTRDFHTALTLSRDALAQNPQDAKIWTLQGVALAGLQDNEQALKAFRQALSFSSDYLPALQGEAEIEFATHNPAAKSTLHRVLALHPDDAVAHAMLGAISYREKDCTQAVQHYERSGQLIRSQPSALREFGTCLLRINKPQEAANVVEELIATDPHDGVARYMLAAAQLMEHSPREALATLSALNDSRVPAARIAELSASAYEMLGDTPRAVETLRSAIVRDPTDEDLYISFASLCLDHRSYEVAVKFLNAGIQALPNSYRLHVTRGILYVQLGQYENAARDFDSANRFDPVHSFGSLAQGLSQMQQSKLDQALATTEAEIKRNPKDAFLYYLKAETLRRQGAEPGTPAFRDALQSAERAVSLDPHFSVAQDLLGVLYQKENKLDLAARAFQTALKDDPADQSALYHMLTVARSSGQTTLVAELAKRLSEAKQEAQKREIQASRYSIVESANSAAPEHRP